MKSRDFTKTGPVAMVAHACVLVVVVCLLGAAVSHAATDEADSPLTVYVAVGVLDVDEISSADQRFTINYFAQFRWVDSRLAHDGPGTIRRDITDITAPRFLILNQQKVWSSLLNVVDITPEGEAVFRQRLWGDFSQPLRLHDFPFDKHTFELPMVSFGGLEQQVIMAPDPQRSSLIADNLSVADWRILGYQTEVREIPLTNDVSVQGFVFSFEAERIFTHYVVKYIIPLFLIVMMSWVVFWIDPTEAGSQLSVAVTATLTLIAYHIALAGKLPDIPYLTRMDLFLFCSTLLVFVALVEVVLTSRLARSDRVELARQYDFYSRMVFPAAYLAAAAWALL
ncbi:hypothetical protein F0M18_13935 [Pseudohalioglobus sediminis]|uniref:Neurotransmitter-gated ion-channel ligand-binding domain-containing protein n=1 Tax=Pseudohalioglobus sediminis TaxID=2606449 RepID=A0A5B0WSK8_9GAMM|nr:hypothetical protein [Pseudohalioglobus sediminis]KAA1189457.1 hypothetical protein F0M18_13935 [Pseudohalioglobus sediminis]